MKIICKNRLIGLSALLSIVIVSFSINHEILALDVSHLVAAYPQIPQWAVTFLSTAVNAAGVIAILGGLGLGGIGAAAGVFIRRYGLKRGIVM